MSGQHEVFDKWAQEGIDLRYRRVQLHDDLSPGSSAMVVGNLLWLDKTEGPIELWINSPGGEIQEAWAIYDIVQAMDNEVAAIGYGWIASAATLLLAGATGMRYVTRHAVFLHHAGRVGTDDLSPDELIARGKWTEVENDRWANAMARHTKVRGLKTQEARSEWWKKEAQGELWLDADDMIRHGIADKIYKKP